MRFTRLAAAAIVLAVALPAYAQQPIVIKFSHVVAIDTPKGKAAEYFKKLAEERTKGASKSSSTRTARCSRTAKRWKRCSLARCKCWRRRSRSSVRSACANSKCSTCRTSSTTTTSCTRSPQGPVGAALFKKLESKGIVGLAYWDNGFKVMSANKPIRVPADYKGLKMRIQSSKVLGDEIKALGGIPQVMAFSEVYQALQTGVVDGTENPPSNFYTQKMQEVQKYLALTDHGYLGYAVIANKKFWDGLPADIRTALDGAMKDATKYANDIAKKENDDSIEAVRKTGKTEIITLTADKKAAMKKALVVVHKENESRVGKDTIAEVYKETGFKP